MARETGKAMARIPGRRIGKKISARAKDAGKTVKSAAGGIHGPSPDPKTNFVIADIALRGGGMLLRHGVERGILGIKYSPQKAKDVLKGRTMGETLLGTAIARIATRSVPGAILVCGGLLAKTLYDRKKGKQAERDGEAKIEEMASKARKG
jgi:hypothetical protein